MRFRAVPARVAPGRPAARRPGRRTCSRARQAPRPSTQPRSSLLLREVYAGTDPDTLAVTVFSLLAQMRAPKVWRKGRSPRKARLSPCRRILQIRAFAHEPHRMLCGLAAYSDDWAGWADGYRTAGNGTDGRTEQALGRRLAGILFIFAT